MWPFRPKATEHYESVWRDCPACEGRALRCAPIMFVNMLSGAEADGIAKGIAEGKTVFNTSGCLPVNETVAVVQFPVDPPEQCPACEGSGGRYHRRLAEEDSK